MTPDFMVRLMRQRGFIESCEVERVLREYLSHDMVLYNILEELDISYDKEFEEDKEE